MVVQCVRLFLACRQLCDCPGGESGHPRASKGPVDLANPHVPWKALLRPLPVACFGCGADHSGFTIMARWILSARLWMVSNTPDYGKYLMALG